MVGFLVGFFLQDIRLSLYIFAAGIVLAGLVKRKHQLMGGTSSVSGSLVVEVTCEVNLSFLFCPLINWMIVLAGYPSMAIPQPECRQVAAKQGKGCPGAGEINGIIINNIRVPERKVSLDRPQGGTKPKTRGSSLIARVGGGE